MLYNIKSLSWDTTLMKSMNIPGEILPAVLPSSGIFGCTREDIFDGVQIPIAGIAGDQQAALFGQTCFDEGAVKNTYGTGNFILMNTGGVPVESKSGLISTIAWGLEGGVDYALEGSIFVTGAAVQWLRDEMKIIDTAAESETLAMSVNSTEGVYVVPAFAGLGAPHWDMYARGIIAGITRGTGREHIVRATLESLAYQTRDVAECMENDSGIALSELKVDGGASGNNFLMQFQADILGIPVRRPVNVETTARGAAFLAGLAVGFWHDREELKAADQTDRFFYPEIDEIQRQFLYNGWQRAVDRSRGWEVHEA
jgi:glycerol kinase